MWLRGCLLHMWHGHTLVCSSAGVVRWGIWPLVKILKNQLYSLCMLLTWQRAGFGEVLAVLKRRCGAHIHIYVTICIWNKIGCLKLQVIFCKEATDYRALLREMSSAGAARWNIMERTRTRTRTQDIDTDTDTEKDTDTDTVTHTSEHTYTCIYLYICIHIYPFTCIHTYIDIYIHMYMYIYIYICVWYDSDSYSYICDRVTLGCFGNLPVLQVFWGAIQGCQDP